MGACYTIGTASRNCCWLQMWRTNSRQSARLWSQIARLRRCWWWGHSLRLRNRSVLTTSL